MAGAEPNKRAKMLDNLDVQEKPELPTLQPARRSQSTLGHWLDEQRVLIEARSSQESERKGERARVGKRRAV